MVELVPRPFAHLVSRMFREYAARQSIFDLPASKFFVGEQGYDLSVNFHGRRAGTALGPAAGPHSQLAQNIVLAWLGGSRVIELKTVQVLDELAIPRPCIDMRNVGYNVEWSQELRLGQSLDEYVKASMLIEMLVASSEPDVLAECVDVIFDMSVGYDLAGIRSAGVRAFLEGMMDASAVVERLRAEIPDDYAHLRDLPFKTKLSDTLTLSTFHGCPPEEIEQIIDYLLREYGLNCVVKLNPTLLGQDEVNHLLQGELGYEHIAVPTTAFEKDTTWDQAVGFVERLRATAGTLGLGFGVKFSNTLVVQHDGEFLPAAESEKYLSGPPLHVLATHLVGRFRRQFGAEIPISFSAGIDKGNFADAVAMGLTPITVCSDLLKPGGYARQISYLHELVRRMGECGARDVADFIQKSAGDEAATHEEAVLHNTAQYVREVARNPHYAHAGNSKAPKKVGTRLVLFDCITCDKCIPVCPNDANFTLEIEPRELTAYVLREVDGKWVSEAPETVALAKKHQIANYADFCNECGNCDVFCPEDGGPYLEKPRFFGSAEEWHQHVDRDGFFMELGEESQRVMARFDGTNYQATFRGDSVHYSGDDFAVEFERADPKSTASGHAEGPVDMKWIFLMDVLRESVCRPGAVNWVNS